jgi:3',5'-cyclic-nucleotide phosphodiesterase
VLTDRIKGYLVSHAHLDHVAGLLIAFARRRQEADLLSCPSVGAASGRDLFQLGRLAELHRRGKAPAAQEIPDRRARRRRRRAGAGHQDDVTAFRLPKAASNRRRSWRDATAMPILYFGDTGPDAVEKATRMRDVWTAVAEKARQRKLKAILIESSYTSDRPDAQLFGHLTPKWIMQSLHELDCARRRQQCAERTCPVVITHIKYALTARAASGADARRTHGRERSRRALPDPQQAMRWHFR